MTEVNFGYGGLHTESFRLHSPCRTTMIARYLSPTDHDKFRLTQKSYREHSMPAPQKEPLRPAKNPTFVDPRIDWGFKRILADEKALVNFLNAFLPPGPKIKSAKLTDKEKTGRSPNDRTIIFDVHAIGTDETRHIIEIQRIAQKHFTGRSQFYIAREINEQGKRGDWNYQLTPISLIAVLDHVPKQSWIDDSYLYHFEALELRNKERLDNLWSISYVVLPKYNLQWSTELDDAAKWCYFLRNLASLSDEQTEIFRSSELFGTMAEKLRIAALTKEEREMAQYADMNHWDRCAVEDAARESGIEIGIPKGKELGRLETDVEHYQKLKDRGGMGDKEICEILEWTKEHLNTIKRAVTSPKLEPDQNNPL